MKKIAFVCIAAIALIASCSKKTTAPAATAMSPVEVYKTNCSRCHGETGVEGKAPNLSQTKYDKAGLINIITFGKDHMPAFEKRLSATDIEAVTNYVLSIKK